MPTLSPPFPVKSTSSPGFSLVEIAIVLVIISVLATMVAIPLATQLDLQRRTDTEKQLETIREAIYGFAIATGRLPCPATATSAGRESFCTLDLPAACGLEIVGTYTADGRCFNSSGFVPAATLSLSPADAGGFSVDPWGLSQNRVRYALSPRSVIAGTPTACTTNVNNILSQANGIKMATMGCLSDPAATVNLLTVVSTTVTNVAGGCIPTDLTTKAPFVIFSIGKNAATGGTGADEGQNVSVGATTFVSHIPTPAGNCAGECDDLVTWGSLNTLFARMVQAGKLP